MPVERAAVRMLAARLAVLVEIGQHVDLGMFLVAVILAEHVHLHLAEIACEGDLRRRRQIDVTEKDQLVRRETLRTPWRTAPARPLP